MSLTTSIQDKLNHCIAEDRRQNLLIFPDAATPSFGDGCDAYGDTINPHAHICHLPSIAVCRGAIEKDNHFGDIAGKVIYISLCHKHLAELLADEEFASSWRYFVDTEVNKTRA